MRIEGGVREEEDREVARGRRAGSRAGWAELPALAAIRIAKILLSQLNDDNSSSNSNSDSDSDSDSSSSSSSSSSNNNNNNN